MRRSCESHLSGHPFSYPHFKYVLAETREESEVGIVSLCHLSPALCLLRRRTLFLTLSRYSCSNYNLPPVPAMRERGLRVVPQSSARLWASRSRTNGLEMALVTRGPSAGDGRTGALFPPASPPFPAPTKLPPRASAFPQRLLPFSTPGRRYPRKDA